ncbi:MAG: GrdB-related putative oxidoreductase [Erysipelotrichaceae bacterium]
MKIVMIFDQIQSGLGTKDDKMLPLGGKKEAIGPAIMMEKVFKQINGQILACLYCGNGTFQMNPDEISRKFCAMVQKLQPDIVICGPAFNFLDYAAMCGKIANDLNKLGVPVLAAMSKENIETIDTYKHLIPIVRTPAKGDVGLNQALSYIGEVAKQIVNKEVDETFIKKVCF